MLIITLKSNKGLFYNKLLLFSLLSPPPRPPPPSLQKKKGHYIWNFYNHKEYFKGWKK